MARIACGVNACCHRHVPYDVINKRLPVENAERLAELLNDIVSIGISTFNACYAFGFLYIVFEEHNDHILLKLYSF